MKIILTSLFVASICAPLGFSAEEKCDKCKKDKKESTLVAADDDCKGGCKKKKEESTLLTKDCDKCKDEKKEKGTLA